VLEELPTFQQQLAGRIEGGGDQVTEQPEGSAACSGSSEKDSLHQPYPERKVGVGLGEVGSLAVCEKLKKEQRQREMTAVGEKLLHDVRATRSSEARVDVRFGVHQHFPAQQASVAISMTGKQGMR
jgi:hypothetical protein